MIDRTSTETLLAENAVAFRSRRDVVIAEGKDAAEYLHGQLSQTVTGLAVGQSAWSLLLSPQGKVDAWMRVTRAGEERFVLDLDEGFGEAALARLKRFKLRVVFDLTFSTLDWVAVRGPASSQHRPDGSGAEMIADLAWENIDGFDLFGEDLATPVGLDEGDAEAFEALRIQLAIPRLGSEIGEKTIPAEVGVVELSADFTKGCYVGQELVARVDSRGNNTPRTMRRLHLDMAATGEPAAQLVGQPLQQAGEDVGSVTSAAASGDAVIVLASVKRAADLDAPFSVSSATGQVAATLVPDAD